MMSISWTQSEVMPRLVCSCVGMQERRPKKMIELPIGVSLRPDDIGQLGLIANNPSVGSGGVRARAWQVPATAADDL